ncbi:uncharacterized transmembrane protein DDB_G0289901-like [Sardina pilchardus]|uniref:uncharacterized transmembrane protein DDB_G0289901-like n=1 Tax=Sardina pilchardus TaxID=27697 RepID=UPI002E162FFD
MEVGALVSRINSSHKSGYTEGGSFGCSATGCLARSVPSNGLCLPANQQLALSTVLSTVYRQFSASGQSAVWIVDSFLGQSAARIIYSFLNYGSNESVFTDSRRCSRGTTTGTSGGSGLSSGGGSGGSASVSDSAGPSSSGGGSSSDSSNCGAYRPGADSSSKSGRDTGSSTGCGSTGACSASAVTATGAITACPLSCCPGRTTNSCCSCNRTFSCYTASPPGPLTAPTDCEGAPHPSPPQTLPRTTPAPHVLPLPLAAAHHAGPQVPALQLLDRTARTTSSAGSTSCSACLFIQN